MINLFDPSTVELPLCVVERARLTQHVLGHRLTRNSRDQNKKKTRRNKPATSLFSFSQVLAYVVAPLTEQEKKNTNLC